MSHWVRLWEDMPTDPKWRVIARRAGRPIAEVLSVFVFMMTNAGGATARGSLENWNDEDVAAALDMDPEHVEAIRDAMQGKTLDGDQLTGWEKRQPKRERDEDKSTPRVQAFRDKKRHETPCNATERLDKIREDTDKIEDAAASSPPAPARKAALGFEAECRSLVGNEPVLLSLDFHTVSQLLTEGITEADVKAGIAAAMAKPDFRITRWGQLAGWARKAAQDRMAGSAKGKVAIATPAEKVWVAEGTPGYLRWEAERPKLLKIFREERSVGGVMQLGALMPSEFPPAHVVAA